MSLQCVLNIVRRKKTTLNFIANESAVFTTDSNVHIDSNECNRQETQCRTDVATQHMLETAFIRHRPFSVETILNCLYLKDIFC